MTKTLKSHNYRKCKRVANIMNKLYKDLKSIDKLKCMEIIDVVIFSESIVLTMLPEIPETERSTLQAQWWNNVTELTRPSTVFNRTYLAHTNGMAVNVSEDIIKEIVNVALERYGIGGDEDKALENFKLKFMNKRMYLKLENLVEIYLETRERVRDMVANLKSC